MRDILGLFRHFLNPPGARNGLSRMLFSCFVSRQLLVSLEIGMHNAPPSCPDVFCRLISPSSSGSARHDSTHLLVSRPWRDITVIFSIRMDHSPRAYGLDLLLPTIPLDTFSGFQVAEGTVLTTLESGDTPQSMGGRSFGSRMMIPTSRQVATDNSTGCRFCKLFEMLTQGTGESCHRSKSMAMSTCETYL